MTRLATAASGSGGSHERPPKGVEKPRSLLRISEGRTAQGYRCATSNSASCRVRTPRVCASSNNLLGVGTRTRRALIAGALNQSTPCPSNARGNRANGEKDLDKRDDARCPAQVSADRPACDTDREGSKGGFGDRRDRCTGSQQIIWMDDTHHEIGGRERSEG